MAPKPDLLSVAKLRARSGTHRFPVAWIRDEQDARATLDGCYFDAAAGQRVIDFFGDFLRHSKGRWAGQPFALLPWQEDATRRLFGWKRVDGTRRYRHAYFEVPKKNGKSTWLAGLELYLLVGDGEAGAEVYCCAFDRDQASIVFDEAATMVRKSPELSAILDINETHKTITYLEQAAKFRALSAEVAKQEGLNIHGLCFDELHTQRTRAMWDTLLYGGAAREQPIKIAITTAGVYEPHAIGWEQHEYARKILSGQVEDWTTLALIYAADDADDWKDPKVWARVNPSWGVTIDPQTFAEECRKAQQSTVEENTFRRYRLNQWVQQVTRWIPLEVWDANHAHPVAAHTLAGRKCWGGLDLGSVSDLTASVLLFECPEEPGALDVLARFWIPEAVLRAAKSKNRALYQQWVDAGILQTTPGSVTDYDFVEADLVRDAQTYDIQSVAIDRLFQGQSVANHLSEEGLTVVAFGQGFLSMGPPMKEFERRWVGRRIHHGGHPILRWMADNAEVKQDPAGNLKIVKPNHHSDPRKVDGLVALVMALDGITRQKPVEESCYLRHGVRSLADFL